MHTTTTTDAGSATNTNKNAFRTTITMTTTKDTEAKGLRKTLGNVELVLSFNYVGRCNEGKK